MFKRIFVLGGSFDPFHLGHEAIVSALLPHCDGLIVVPCGTRSDKALRTNYDCRLRMVAAGLSTYLGSGKLFISEAQRSGHLFTVHLMRKLRLQRPKDRLQFVLGTDLVNDVIENWQEGATLLKQTDFVVVQRKGNQIAALPEQFSKQSTLLTLDLPQLSSTLIRQLIAKGDPCEGLLSAQVLRIIKDEGLYLPK